MNRFGETTLILALATVAVLGSAAPLLPLVATVDHYPRYAYNYAVHDPLTKDNKAQWEIRDGDVVKGSYTLVEPDGSVRVVDYFADDHTGFNADVKRFGPKVHPNQLSTHVTLPLNPTTPVLQPIVAPLNYGFGAAPITIGLPKLASFGKWSLPWDSFTGSYGGWVPLSHKGPYATIFSKKYVNGKLHKWVTGPIPLTGNKLVFRTKH